MPRSSRWRTTGSWVICSRWFPSLPKKSRSCMARGEGRGERFVPANYQPLLPTDRLVLKEGSEGAGDRMELDVLIVGAGAPRPPPPAQGGPPPPPGRARGGDRAAPRAGGRGAASLSAAGAVP